ncbi:MAG: redoxin family protein [Vicinamibacterales bacterium]
MGARLRRRMLRAGSTVVIAAITVTLLAVGEASAADPVRVLDLEGRQVDPLVMARGARALVVIFVDVECPVSNRYAPELRRLHERFEPLGAEFLLVYANPLVSPDAVREHQSAFGHPGRVVRDPEHALVRDAGVTVTPEAVVYNTSRQVVYRGRIDDRYVRLGVERPAASRHDLADAIDATLNGRAVATPRTDAVGCYVADFVHVH